jgi:hypothetical protein
MTSNPAAPSKPAALQSPNDLLASQITEALVAAGLIKDAHKGPLLSKLKTGGVKQEDWNLWIDMATAPQVAQGEANNE